MMSFDSVPPDTATITAVPASAFRYVQTVAPSVLHVFALVVYVIIMICAGHVHPRVVNTTLTVAMLCVLMASLLRRIAPFVFIEVGHYRYERVSATVTRLLPNTYQSWFAVQTLVVVAVGHPLCLYLFTHYTAKGNLYAFAMFGLPGTLMGPLFALCLGILICAGLLGVLVGVVFLPAKGYNPFHVRAPGDRVRTWICLSSWFPLTLLLMVLFCVGRLLPCDGTHTSDTATSPPYTCGSGAQWFAGMFAWLLTAVSFVSLDVGIGFLRLLGGKDVPYYALEPRLDGLFCELLVWALKVTAVATVLLASVALYIITAALFLGLLVFTLRRHTATSEALEGIIRWTMTVVLVTCVMSCFMSIGSIPALVQGLLILLAWLISVGCAVALYHRRFGWELFGSGSGITADLIVV
ncbi:hypothetical protein conserved [Leishmania donovani]|uniref:Uncharacterized protein n=4 Tax=Leishmania donovani species complex TaxID=38574 RepID=E9AHZ4_LEIIN|nr:conserved hypothetical protein [Leishmania infantum JPCM5]XP_003865804.1 hypothetical protein, conserved [Leishmania donovani]CAC9553357.1 hypothetical_protein_-_conserved [Leishmania infantum]AYU84098.1 hypothetical protein LdCL_360081800 [Leishmania donovani]CAJ1994078.1 hypothetical protein conserved [Leishmania donovani]CBZ09054.1 conserved hypothetical protein [Leishmania infantum JPCM5]CBZ39128.1 hypothetical protein, conserved [Leishmania donovani]|eukprot:XP_003392845.1 conserved hypothetical protein [Leishmania infantum JPCM5]